MENNQIIKNIFKVNILVYILGIIAILIGSFKEYLILNIIIIVHELGHFLVAKLLKVDVKKIYIYPLGGITKFNMPLNTKNIIEFLVLIAGPLFQNIAYFILIYLFPYDKELILNYNKKTIGIRETNDKGYTSYISREYDSIEEMMLYISRYFSITDWRIIGVEQERKLLNLPIRAKR